MQVSFATKTLGLMVAVMLFAASSFALPTTSTDSNEAGVAFEVEEHDMVLLFKYAEMEERELLCTKNDNDETGVWLCMWNTKEAADDDDASIDSDKIEEATQSLQGCKARCTFKKFKPRCKVECTVSK